MDLHEKTTGYPFHQQHHEATLNSKRLKLEKLPKINTREIRNIGLEIRLKNSL